MKFLQNTFHTHFKTWYDFPNVPTLFDLYKAVLHFRIFVQFSCGINLTHIQFNDLGFEFIVTFFVAYQK